MTYQAGRAWALFSADLRHRLALGRWFHDGPVVPERLLAFIGLNPSTADGQSEDATTRRWRGFTLSLGFPGYVAVNAHTLRSPDPNFLLQARYARTPTWTDEGRVEMLAILATAATIICCWGATVEKVGHGMLNDPLVCDALRQRAADIYCLGTPTKNGHPRHALYLPATANLRPYSAAYLWDNRWPRPPAAPG